MFGDGYAGGCICLVVLVSVASVHLQGYFVVEYHRCAVFSDCPSLVCFMGYGSIIDGERES